MASFLGWAWKSGYAACAACVGSGRVPEFWEGSSYRATVYGVRPYNCALTCFACGARVEGECCLFESIRRSEVAEQQNSIEQARQVIQHVAWMHPEAMQRLHGFEIVNDEQQSFAAGLLQEIKAEWKDVEEKRKSITKPLHDAHKNTQAVFKPALEALEKAEEILKDKIAAYMASKQQANTAMLQAAAYAPTAEQAQALTSTVAPVAAPAGVSVRYVWRFEVTNPDAVPRELCSPDLQKIAAALQAKADKYGSPDLIPGVRTYQEPIVSARST